MKTNEVTRIKLFFDGEKWWCRSDDLCGRCPFYVECDRLEVTKRPWRDRIGGF